MNFSIPKKIVTCLSIVVIVIIILWFSEVLDQGKIKDLLRENYEEDDELDLDDLEKYKAVPELDEELFKDEDEDEDEDEDVNPETALEQYVGIPELDSELFNDNEEPNM